MVQGDVSILKPQEVIHKIIESDEYFPNNPIFPLLIYKNVLNIVNQSEEVIQAFLKKNSWDRSWVNSIYDFHHYHSNTHEALVIFAGTCTVQIGGNNGHSYDIAKGDVIIFPAGVSHKKIHSSSNFKTIGAYPFNIQYDMKYGKKEEYEQAKENIKKVGLPVTDPIFGKAGILFDYWK